MHGIPPLNLLLDSVDPTHEMNDDPDTKRELAVGKWQGLRGLRMLA